MNDIEVLKEMLAVNDAYAWEITSERKEAFKHAISRLDLFDRVGAVMPKRKETLPEIVSTPEMTYQQAVECILREGFNEALDLCTAAIAGKVGRIEGVVEEHMYDDEYLHADAKEIAKAITDLLLEGEG